MAVTADTNAGQNRDRVRELFLQPAVSFSPLPTASLNEVQLASATRGRSPEALGFGSMTVVSDRAGTIDQESRAFSALSFDGSHESSAAGKDGG